MPTSRRRQDRHRAVRVSAMPSTQRMMSTADTVVKGSGDGGDDGDGTDDSSSGGDGSGSGGNDEDGNGSGDNNSDGVGGGRGMVAQSVLRPPYFLQSVGVAVQ